MIVAKAWTDPEFKEALLTTGREALREMGVHQGKVGKLVVVENTDKTHNLIVCTLCSCYPYDILGDTPWWYKHESYRTKIVQNPRACAKEMFQLELPANKEVQVWDSTSDVRYFVLPQRPAGTEGMSEEDLAKLVTVDSLIGAGYALEPEQQQEARKPEQRRKRRESGPIEKLLWTPTANTKSATQSWSPSKIPQAIRARRNTSAANAASSVWFTAFWKTSATTAASTSRSTRLNSI